MHNRAGTSGPYNGTPYYGNVYGAQATAGPSRGGHSHGDQRGGRGRGRGRGRSGRGNASATGQGYQGGRPAPSSSYIGRPVDNGYGQRQQQQQGYAAPTLDSAGDGAAMWATSQDTSGYRAPMAARQQSSRPSGGTVPPERGLYGHLVCGCDIGGGQTCQWRSGSELSMTLHRSDRHLVYPSGGADALARMDPLLAEERREKARRAKKRTADDEAEEENSSLIPGLNIKLDTPELINKWIEERKKRWPSQAAIEKKRALTWADSRASRAPRVGDRDAPSRDKTQSGAPAAQPQAAAERSSASSSDSSSDASDSSSEDDSSGSDVDEERDAVSSKVAPPAAEELDTQSAGECRFFARGRCRDGDACKYRHDTTRSQAVPNGKPELATGAKKRRRPRAASPNPFDAPHLLRALLRNEIAQHVNYVAQVTRFLVRNDFLKDVERRAGDAERQQKQRSLVQVVPTALKADEPALEKASKSGSDTERSAARAPLVEGALPIVDAGLYEPQSPTLRPLEQLSLPPEPDEFLLMDPLRAQDAQPLTHQQYRDLAQDVGIRALLVEEDKAGHPTAAANNKLSQGMMRALQTLDALPTYAHRASAIEQILGISEQSAHHAHQLGPTYIRADRTSSSIAAVGGSNITASASSLAGQAGGPTRVIGENELFRLGLRAGPVEIKRLRQLAGRISALIGGPEFAEEVNEAQPANAEASIRPWYDEATRHEMRRQQWARQGEWRDQMRKLGVEVD